MSDCPSFLGFGLGLVGGRERARGNGNANPPLEVWPGEGDERDCSLDSIHLI